MAAIARKVSKMDEAILERMGAYSFFTQLFMVLPDEGFVEAVLSDGFASSFAGLDHEAAAAFSHFKQENENKPAAEVLQAIAIDRARLLRGTGDGEVQPPYESLYLSAPSERSCHSVAAAYRAAGLAPAESTAEPPEYIGCEMGFMYELCRRQAEALQAGNESAADESFQQQIDFFANHLGRWGRSYGETMATFAKTDFFRGVGLLLTAFITEERMALDRGAVA